MKRRFAATTMLLAAATVPTVAHAYVGPGAGLSLMGALWALVAAVGLAMAMVIGWPLRRMLRQARARRAANAQPQAATEGSHARSQTPDA